MYKVVLVDDEQLILNGLIRVIPWVEHDCEVVATANDGIEGAAVIRRERPDILFTDVRMPNMDGLKMIAALKSEFPDMQISVLTAFRDFEYAQQAIRLGVARFLLKPSKMPELQEAIIEMTARLDARKPAEDETEDRPPPEDEEASSFIVQAALDYMRQHYMEHIRLSDVADQIYVSQWHLSKLISRYTDSSFLGILSNLRVDRAKELLREPTLKVHEIATLTGFQDVAHFSKTFKKITGLSPVEYRQKDSKAK
ncbi:response regulator [Eubacteriales bacterium OttesenSCG-928-N13]|nr:response regulator [Eubacteriales bacterium OttesenSCG-928-N13]